MFQLLAVFWASFALASDVPEEILTPDKVQTSLGELEFRDGVPTEATAQLLHDNLFRTRAIDVFLDMIPMASLEGLRRGHAAIGVDASNKVMIMQDLMTSDPFFLTGNTDTVYASAFLNLEKDGPTVVEVPPGAGPGTVNDAFFRFVTDMGMPGPDRGKGGKYLILPPNYEGDVPDGYFAATSPSYTNWVILRGMTVKGDPEPAADMWRSGLKIYPLSQAESPPKMAYINATGEVFNTIHANNVDFYNEIDAVIQREPVDFIDPELRGLLTSIGMVKGTPFEPDEREQALLVDAAAIANGTARTLMFDSRSPTIHLYGETSQWMTAFDGGSYEWLYEKGLGGRNLDARTLFFYMATVNTPAMVLKLPGKGSQYAWTATDSDGAYFDGGESYSLTLPADVPAKNFWSVVLYDTQTRSMLQTDDPYPSINSQTTKRLKYNKDGSITLYFSPEPPKKRSLRANWVRTLPNKGWFTLLRLYGPLEPWFEKTWRPGEFERMSQE